MISISILWCAGFDDITEDEPDDYHDCCCVDSDNEAALWAAALSSCVWTLDQRFIKRLPSRRVESPATVKDPAAPQLWPESGQVGPGTSGHSVIRWQHMFLLRVHNLDAYM